MSSQAAASEGLSRQLLMQLDMSSNRPWLYVQTLSRRSRSLGARHAQMDASVLTLRDTNGYQGMHIYAYSLGNQIR